MSDSSTLTRSQEEGKAQRAPAQASVPHNLESRVMFSELNLGFHTASTALGSLTSMSSPQLSDHCMALMIIKLTHSRAVDSLRRFTLLLICLLTVCYAENAYAQVSQNIEEMKQRAAALMEQNKYTQALPLLEKIVVAEPDSAETHFFLGFALLGQANNTVDDHDRKLLRIRARNAFIRSRELGNREPLVQGLIGSLPADGSEGPAVSKNLGAQMSMVKAEGFFSQGKFDDALALYQKALALDPNLYEAALFSGDIYNEKKDFAQAESWYQKAIAIDPLRETAYRYSATPLMKQGKVDQARERYIEAFITEPYSRFSVSGITQWAEVTNTRLAHPEIDIPTQVTFDEKGDVRINLDATALLGGKNDGSFAWISYGATRSLWRKEKFAKQFPAEMTYRHSLPEEVDALRSVVSLAAADKKTKTLSPSLAMLKKLNDEGLLEAFVLLARPDEGIARDHLAYLKENRAKLHRYVASYVIAGGKTK